MKAESFKRILSFSTPVKIFLRKTRFYSFVKDHIFLNEQKKEKKIEKKYGIDGMIKYCKKWYKTATGYELNLDNPVTFTEKQQWLKIYDQNQNKVTCSDKYAVREYVKKRIGEEYLVPLIRVDGADKFYNAFDIDFDKLPNQFVLSCNHGSSMTIVINDKSKLKSKDIKNIKKQLNRWLKIDVSYVNAFDFVYKGIKPCIIITEYLSNGNNDLKDYKFFCFNGEPKYMWIDSGRFNKHKRTVYDMSFNKMPFRYGKFLEEENKKPVAFEQMVILAKCLCKEFKLVRVDFYDVDGRIYFGELTFNSGAGRDLIYPNEYNIKLGEELVI